MRYLPSMFAALVALVLMSPAQATDDAAPAFIPATDLQLAQRDTGDDQEERDADEERRDRAEERRDRAEARRQRAEEREARRREEEDHNRADRDEDRDYRRPSHYPRGRFWVGIGAGAGAASIAVPCGNNPPSAPKDCTQSGDTGTYTANVTITGPYTALRIRGIREQDKGDDDRTPYEEAILIGSRFGASNWYGLVGAGRILHADDRHPEDTAGFAWEILFAPSSASALGMELSFQGELGNDVDFAALNLGMRFGALR